MSEQAIAGATVLGAPARDQLRILTCGSVDDGKSTLIGRLLLDASLVLDDHLAALTRDSKTHGTVRGDIDPALLVDGLEAEREQGITIDVAYRYFGTARRRFIVADTPGHKDYTRNMATGASTSELAILLVDASKGILEQTRRHAFICSLLRIRHFVLAVNKMDLVGFNEGRFNGILDSFLHFAERFSGVTVVAIPTAALLGDNVVRASARMPWYQGPKLLEYIETVVVDRNHDVLPLRLPVQYVSRPNAEFRGYAGTVMSGVLHKDMEVLVSRTGTRTRITSIVTMDGELESAEAGDAVTVLLADNVDISRGDIIAVLDKPPQRADAFAAHIVWMAENPLLAGRTYILKCGGQTLSAVVTELKYRVDVETFEHLAAKELQLNEIAFVNVATAEPISFDPYDDNRDTGGFILIDRHSNATVAAGMIRFGLRRAANTYFQAFDVTKSARAQLNAQKPALLWFTGLSGAGKSTIANMLEKKLHAFGKHTFVLDGDNVRHGLNRDLGFTEGDRVENIRRVAEVAKLFVDAGLITIVSFISPFRAEREMARELVDPGEFVEVFVDTPLATCEERDPKGLYGKARRGELRNFTGIDSPYEPPLDPELRLDARSENAADLADRIIAFMQQRGMLS
ncbi:MAG TPA: sulfate adenylyltransferase subunit CysN [Xanthobacteraceae bacterium]|nr:sulfate adenylyltransferase subunit CysN [Xanthobacteraceae bacterium]